MGQRLGPSVRLQPPYCPGSSRSPARALRPEPLSQQSTKTDRLQHRSLFLGSGNRARSSRNTELPKSIQISTWQCLCYYHIMFRSEDHDFHHIFIGIWDHLAPDTALPLDLPPVLGKIHCSLVVTPQLVRLPRQKPQRKEPPAQPGSPALAGPPSAGRLYSPWVPTELSRQLSHSFPALSRSRCHLLT